MLLGPSQLVELRHHSLPQQGHGPWPPRRSMDVQGTRIAYGSACAPGPPHPHRSRRRWPFSSKTFSGLTGSDPMTPVATPMTPLSSAAACRPVGFTRVCRGNRASSALETSGTELRARFFFLSPPPPEPLSLRSLSFSVSLSPSLSLFLSLFLSVLLSRSLRLCLSFSRSLSQARLCARAHIYIWFP